MAAGVCGAVTGAAIAQPGDEAPRADRATAGVPGAAPLAGEPVLSMIVLRESGEVVATTWLSIDAAHVRLVEAESGRLLVMDRSEVLGVFSAAAGARAALGIGGIGSALQRPLLPAARVSARARASLGPAIRGTDGVALSGQPSPISAPSGTTNDAGQSIVWSHGPLGLWSFQIDRIAWAWLGPIGDEWLGITDEPPTPGPRAAAAPSRDTMALSNGDRLEGFVVALGGTAEFEAVDGAPIDVPIDRIAGLWLANPTMLRVGVWAFTDDGSAVPLADIVGGSDTGWIGSLDTGSPRVFTFSQLNEPRGPRDRLDLSNADIVALLLAAERIVPLSTIEPQSVVAATRAGGEGGADGLVVTRRHPLDVALPTGPAFEAHDLLLSRALEARWQLPEGTRRFVATAALPDARNPWSGATLVLLVDGREAGRLSLTPERPAASINIAAVGRSLTLRVEPGPLGPVQNAITLHRPLLIRGGEGEGGQ